MSTTPNRILNAYFAEIRTAKILKYEDQLKAFKEYRTCSKCQATYAIGEVAERICSHCGAKRSMVGRDAILKSALRFVVKTAILYAKKAHMSVDNDDVIAQLISAGNEGLLVAIDRFDPEKGVRFLTYATHWVRERILVELDHMGVVRVPSYRQKEIRLLRKQGEEGARARSPVSLEGFDETNEHDSDYDLDRNSVNKYGVEVLYKAFTDLGFDSRERYVLIAYFGLRDEPKNLRQIASRLQLSAERIRQIKENSIKALVKHLKKTKVTQVSDAFVEN